MMGYINPKAQACLGRTETPEEATARREKSAKAAGMTLSEYEAWILVQAKCADNGEAEDI